MKYIFDCSARYLTSKCSERVRYKVEQEKRYSISSSNRVLFCLSYRYTDNDVFDDFPKISDHFPKILQKLSKGHTNISEQFPKMSEDYRRLRKTLEDDPKMFRSYTNKFKVKQDISEVIDIFTTNP